MCLFPASAARKVFTKWNYYCPLKPTAVSVYEKSEMRTATMEALNSVKGQQALKDMDNNPTKRDHKIRVDMTGNWYGDARDNVKKRISDVTVIFMRLGDSTLWIHTSYPTGFV